LLSGNPDELLDFFSKTVIILLFILLYTKRLNWAKWTLSVLLVFFGLLYLAEAVIDDTYPLYLNGLFDIFFGVFIHTSKALEQFRTKEQSNQETTLTYLPSGQVADFNYPRLIKRYKALLADVMLILAILTILMLLVQDNEYRPTIMVTAGLILIFCYEPVLTTYSGTIGQRIMKIKVRRHEQPDKRLSLINSYIRWFTKGLLGWLSFITINFNKEHRAIHDYASDSIMLEKNEKTAPNNVHI
jgi:uncharacterized RDD family membrane protein YckC